MQLQWKSNYAILMAIVVIHAMAQNTSVPGGPTFSDFLRFSCSELNIQRIDP
jgi:hypothetical protein